VGDQAEPGIFECFEIWFVFFFSALAQSAAAGSAFLFSHGICDKFAFLGPVVVIQCGLLCIHGLFCRRPVKPNWCFEGQLVLDLQGFLDNLWRTVRGVAANDSRH
jgi:hypothetical protein